MDWSDPEQRNAYARERYAAKMANPLWRQEREHKHDTWRLNHTWRKRYMVVQARKRASKKGIPFDLKPEDFDIPQTCPALGIPILLSATGKRGVLSTNSPSLDRVDNAKGYVRGNVRVISNRANVLKGNATLEEIRRITAYMAGVTFPGQKSRQ